MNKISSSLIKDTIIIFSIAVVFMAVFFVFYIEIIKNNKIKDSKENFFIVLETLTKEINKCKDKEQDWIFGISCKQELTKKIVSDYFNNNKQLTNPFDGYKGVAETPGSVQIDLKSNLLVLSIDTNANGGIDIEHRILIY